MNSHISQMVKLKNLLLLLCDIHFPENKMVLYKPKLKGPSVLVAMASRRNLVLTLLRESPS